MIFESNAENARNFDLEKDTNLIFAERVVNLMEYVQKKFEVYRIENSEIKIMNIILMAMLTKLVSN